MKLLATKSICMNMRDGIIYPKRRYGFCNKVIQTSLFSITLTADNRDTSYLVTFRKTSLLGLVSFSDGGAVNRALQDVCVLVSEVCRSPFPPDQLIPTRWISGSSAETSSYRRGRPNTTPQHSLVCVHTAHKEQRHTCPNGSKRVQTCPNVPLWYSEFISIIVSEQKALSLICLQVTKRK